MSSVRWGGVKQLMDPGAVEKSVLSRDESRFSIWQSDGRVWIESGLPD